MQVKNIILYEIQRCVQYQSKYFIYLFILTYKIEIYCNFGYPKVSVFQIVVFNNYCFITNRPTITGKPYDGSIYYCMAHFSVATEHSEQNKTTEHNGYLCYTLCGC